MLTNQQVLWFCIYFILKFNVEVKYDFEKWITKYLNCGGIVAKEKNFILSSIGGYYTSVTYATTDEQG